MNAEEGNGTCYAYDAIGNLISVLPAQYVSDTDYSSVSDAESVAYSYNSRNLLESITTESTVYHFLYDSFGNPESVSAGTRELAGYEYYPHNGKLKTVQYGNGTSVRYVYDRLDNIKEIWYHENGTETKVFEYTYTAYGQLHRVNDLSTGKSTLYRYDTVGKLTGFVEYDTERMVNEFSSALYYNGEGKLDTLFCTLNYPFASGSADHDIGYFLSYTTDGEIGYLYVTYNRLTSRVYDFSVSGNTDQHYTNTTTYTFIASGQNTSAQVASYTT